MRNIKILFVKAKYKKYLDPSKINLISKKLPKEIAIVYSIQYEDVAKQLFKKLSKDHKITSLIQLLGCSKLKFSKSTKTILLVSDGLFHAKSLAFESGLDVCLYNIYNDTLRKISSEDIGPLEKKQKVAYANYLNSDILGILISLKPGQQKFKTALNLKEKLQNKTGKKSYLFLSNNILGSELENFPNIKCWINTACPRLDLIEDIRIINSIDINNKN
ncbi:MAG TPA: diphthamide synthesis protein [Candidatus Nanoarchaeia archaeon]|nr:diphthamide synthesis protein [Candidatus Nanoarchaeia archaeon]